MSETSIVPVCSNRPPPPAVVVVVSNFVFFVLFVGTEGNCQASKSYVRCCCDDDAVVPFAFVVVLVVVVDPPRPRFPVTTASLEEDVVVIPASFMKSSHTAVFG